MVTSYRMHPISQITISSSALPLLRILALTMIHALCAMSLHRVELRTSSSFYVPAGGVETVTGGPHHTHMQ